MQTVSVRGTRHRSERFPHNTIQAAIGTRDEFKVLRVENSQVVQHENAQTETHTEKQTRYTHLETIHYPTFKINDFRIVKKSDK